VRNDECNSCNINPYKNDECNSCNITVKKQNNAAYVLCEKKLIDCKCNTCNENRPSETSMLAIFYIISENQIKKGNLIRRILFSFIRIFCSAVLTILIFLSRKIRLRVHSEILPVK